MMNTSAACQKCTFFDDRNPSKGASPMANGLCRFNPPVSQPSAESQGLWPVVASNDWCGHFSPEGSAAHIAAE